MRVALRRGETTQLWSGRWWSFTQQNKKVCEENNWWERLHSWRFRWLWYWVFSYLKRLLQIYVGAIVLPYYTSVLFLLKDIQLILIHVLLAMRFIVLSVGNDSVAVLVDSPYRAGGKTAAAKPFLTGWRELEADFVARTSIAPSEPLFC